jgi:hypothetical protein
MLTALTVAVPHYGFGRQVITSLTPLAWAALKRISGLEAIRRRIGR